MYVSKSFCRCASNVAYTVPSSTRDGATSDTHAPFGSPGILSVTFVHDRPVSRDTWTFPSSVPAYRSPWRLGDSPNDTIVGHAWMPSFFAIVISLPFTP